MSEEAEESTDHGQHFDSDAINLGQGLGGRGVGDDDNGGDEGEGLQSDGDEEEDLEGGDDVEEKAYRFSKTTATPPPSYALTPRNDSMVKLTSVVTS